MYPPRVNWAQTFSSRSVQTHLLSFASLLLLKLSSPPTQIHYHYHIVHNVHTFMTMNITNTTITMIITKRRTLSREYFQVSHRQATGKGWKSKNHHHYRIICIILYCPVIEILLRLWKVEIVIFDRICKNLVTIVKFGENIDIFATSIWDGVSVQATSNPDFFSGRPANRRKSSGLFGPWLCQYSSNESFTMSTQVILSIQQILIFFTLCGSFALSIQVRWIGAAILVFILGFASDGCWANFIKS